MRLLFLVPTNIHKATAGSRIRYDRLGLAVDQFDVVVQSFEDLTPADLDACDVCVLSKTFSMEAIAIAYQLRQKGKVVGIDLFDDYFSQADDSRLFRFRMWFRSIAATCQFALCSTHVMQRLIEHYAPELPVHVVPDPFPEIAPASLASTLAAKLERAKIERTVEVVWFGNGSNPFFTVGLEDVAAFSWSLADLNSKSFDVQLTILTDKGSQTSDNLVRLGKLPIRYSLETWSLEAEQAALQRALVAFIPVNGQSFSRAKSFNRALTAISAGAQVLSPGFPLYRALGGAIYSDAVELLSDLKAGRLRMRADNADEIIKAASNVSEIGAVTNGLFEFLSRQLVVKNRNRRSSAETESSLSKNQALIYGFEYDGVMIRASQKLGIFSVKTPFSHRDRAYDLQIAHKNGRNMEIWIAPKVVPLLARPFRDRCSQPRRVGKIMMVKVDLGNAVSLPRNPLISTADRRQILQETFPYYELMADIEEVCRYLFPTVKFFISDMQASAYIGSAAVAATAQP